MEVFGGACCFSAVGAATFKSQAVVGKATVRIVSPAFPCSSSDAECLASIASRRRYPPQLQNAVGVHEALPATACILLCRESLQTKID